MAKFYDRNEESAVFDSYLSFITPNSDVLEFGLATGYNTRYIVEKLHCEVTCIEKIPEMAEKGKKYFSDKLSFANKIVELLYDCGCYFKQKFNLSTPKVITKYIHKPMETADKKRYEKYNA